MTMKCWRMEIDKAPAGVGEDSYQLSLATWHKFIDLVVTLFPNNSVTC
jgi:hypothetical protein